MKETVVYRVRWQTDQTSTSRIVGRRYKTWNTTVSVSPIHTYDQQVTRSPHRVDAIDRPENPLPITRREETRGYPAAAAAARNATRLGANDVTGRVRPAAGGIRGRSFLPRAAVRLRTDTTRRSALARSPTMIIAGRNSSGDHAVVAV